MDLTRASSVVPAAFEATQRGLESDLARARLRGGF
jgi:hypothetical protein